MTTEDELVMQRLTEGMHDPAFKHKLLETLKSVNLTIETFVQQLELIKKGNQQPNEREAYGTNMKFYANTVVNSMSEGKIIAQPLVRYAPFAKEKKSYLKVCRYKKKVEELNDT